MIGLSRPHSFASASCASGLSGLAFGAIGWSGLPGVSRIRTNSTSESTTMVGIMTTSRPAR